jgi:WD40-like Beta Propeller Repeat
MPVTIRAGSILGAISLAVALSACSHGKPAAAPTITITTTAQPSASPSASNSAAVPPAMVAVTSAGALVVLNPATGIVSRTLVAAHVLGDEISASPAGAVYFAVQRGCSAEIESVPVAGGGTTEIATGTLPAVSPDGTKLAYAVQPSARLGCYPSTSNPVPLYNLDIRTLSSGAVTGLPQVPGSQAGTTLPAPISHLSWAADSNHLAVSVSAFQDNEGWNLVLVNTSVAHDYLTGPGTSYVPVTGQPDKQRSYLREGVFMPNGYLFVSRACCGGEPTQNTSRLMWEVTSAGALVHQVAIGFVNLAHTSLAVSPDGNWLLYLAGTDLYVSHAGATPVKLASGLTAAAWG